MRAQQGFTFRAPSFFLSRDRRMKRQGLARINGAPVIRLSSMPRPSPQQLACPGTGVHDAGLPNQRFTSLED
jgi:hypothetical protein